LILAKRGYIVDLYEHKNVDAPGTQLSNGRTINFSIFTRGLATFDMVGLKETIIDSGAHMTARTLNFPHAQIRQPSPPGFFSVPLDEKSCYRY
jgi:hypothetical protein